MPSARSVSAAARPFASSRLPMTTAMPSSPEPPGRLQADPLVRPGDERDLVLRCHGLAPRRWMSTVRAAGSAGPLTGGFYLHIQVIWKTSSQQTAGRPRPTATPCLCAALRQASRAVTRIYDAELRGTGLRSTQHSLLRLLGRVGRGPPGRPGRDGLARRDDPDPQPPPAGEERLGDDPRRGRPPGEAGRDHRGGEGTRSSRPARRGRGPRNGCARTLPDGTWDSLFAALPDVTKAASGEAP